jgi:Domain of unknown function (DUF4412)
MRLRTRLVGALAASLPIAGAAIADTKLTMEEHMVVTLPDSSGAPTESTSEYVLWLRADRAARVGGGVHMIARLDRGESYLLDDAEKTVTVIKFAGLPESLKHAQVKKTSETRTIGAWNAERYDMTVELGPSVRGTAVLWVSDDIDIDLEAYRAFSRALDQGRGFMSAIADLPGYPVLQETNFGIAKGTTRLVSVSDETPPPDTYDPPADYERKD